jgi:hypothetical protein
MPIGSEPVSNMMRLAAMPAAADIVMAGITHKLTIIDCLGVCLLAFACNLANIHLSVVNRAITLERLDP